MRTRVLNVINNKLHFNIMLMEMFHVITCALTNKVITTFGLGASVEILR